MGTDAQRVTAKVSGLVQGVGFRYWVTEQAYPLGVVGAATNLPDGRVEIVAEGPREACEQLVEALYGRNTPGRVTGVDVTWSDATGEFSGFETR